VKIRVFFDMLEMKKICHVCILEIRFSKGSEKSIDSYD